MSFVETGVWHRQLLTIYLEFYGLLMIILLAHANHNGREV
jgi:hypothetical protein